MVLLVLLARRDERVKTVDLRHKQSKYTVDGGGAKKSTGVRFNAETSGFWLPRPFSHSDSSHSDSRLCIQLAAIGSRDFDPHSHVPFRTFAEPVETLKATR